VAPSQVVKVQAGSAQLAGSLQVPDDAASGTAGGRHPTVLLLPSWLPRTRDGDWDRAGHPSWFATASATEPPGLLARLAHALAGRGVASLRCDPRGCGASEGAWEAVDLFTRIDDARDMLAFIRSDRRLDLRRCGIVGHGEGATVALALAGADPAVSALTLIGPPARSFASVLRAGVAARARTGTDRQHPLVAAIDRWSEDLIERAERHEPPFSLPLAGGRVVLDLAWVEQSIRTPARALATMLNRSVSVAHGSLDAWSDPEESRLLADALGLSERAVERRVIPGAGHDLAEASDAQIGELAADLAERLVAVDLPPVLLAIEEMGMG